MLKKYLIFIILFLSIIGFITSVYLAWDHYQTEEGILCDLNESFSCDITKQSQYGELFNIPVGVFGMIWFFVIGGLTLIERKKDVVGLLLIWNILGLFFVGYFVHGEYVLKALCPYCTIAHGCIILIFVVTLDLYRQRRR